ncbi:NAD(P)-dependent oxidoreductase [Streptomyces buecherae]|uniref:NAD(P)-dependent oxidoreductase n=1 Tax=Streptomyces buecherae TaxID=2763006 RepID=UPI0036A81A76
MTIAVLGATGMVGSRVVAEARARGHRVLALARKPTSDDPYVTALAVDAGDPGALRAALAGSANRPAADAVVVALRTEPVDQEFLVGATRAVLAIVGPLGVPVLVVGGAGALRSPADPQLLVADDPAYVPPAIRAVAAAGIAQLDACRADARGPWAYLCPPARLNPGERTGRYRRGTDTLLTDAGGASWISAEDLSVAVLDELENPGPEHLFTVAARPAEPSAG